LAAVPAGKIETDGGSTAIIGVAYDPAPPSTSRRTEGPGMARATSAVPIHQVVLSNLCDLQARLRGEPATLVLARGPVHIDDGTAPTRVAPPTASDDAAIATRRRIAGFQARLAELEHELTSVVDLQRAIDRRLRER